MALRSREGGMPLRVLTDVFRRIGITLDSYVECPSGKTLVAACSETRLSLCCLVLQRDLR